VNYHIVNQDRAETILQQWRESALYWEKYADLIRVMFAPITDAMLEAAGIAKGKSVLDVAGGTGEPSLTIAETIGASGSVTFTDATAGMVAATAREARRRAFANIDFCQCLADALPFPGNSFDVVVSRLGVMLFSDPYAATREMLRAVKPNGRVTLAVWAAAAANPFFKVVTDVISRYIKSPPEDPDAPGAFRFAEPGKLVRLMREVGAEEVTEQIVDFTLEAPLTPAEFWKARAQLSDTLRAKLAQLSSEQLDQVAREVEEAGRAFFAHGRMRFPAQVLIVTAKKKHKLKPVNAIP
jgi:ubiquinone/menaquinone biosynthesis C-methylase UbiE